MTLSRILYQNGSSICSTKAKKLTWETEKWGKVWLQNWTDITKLCTQLHPPPPSSTQLISTSTQLNPSSPSSLQSPPSSLQHPQQYLNQNIARNWAISPNLGQKIQSCPFCLKIGAHSISRMLIPNPDLDFWNFDCKIHFWANLGLKTQSCPFCLKIGAHGISRMLILIPTLVFWIENHNFLFGQTCAKKVKAVCFNWKLAQMIPQGCWFLFQH